MIEVIDEMLEVPGGPATLIMKKDFLHDSIRELATASFSDDSNYLKEKLDALICDSPEDEFDNLLQMQNCNVEMMGFILSGKFEKAKRVLLEMREKCNTKAIKAI